jgi:molecular chaperone HscB
MPCWKCQSTKAASPSCPDCGALQPPPPGRDHFAVLGLPRRFDLERAAIEARHRELSRAFHPDRFAMAEARTRRLSLLWATAVNDASKVLRDPTRRAEYLLKLRGIDLGDERAGQKHVSPAFLMEILDLREAMGLARRAGDAARVRELADAARARQAAAQAEIATLFAELGDREDADLVRRIARTLVMQRYDARLLAEAAAFEDDGVRDVTP